MTKVEYLTDLQNDSLNSSIDELDLSTRFRNILKRRGYNIEVVSDFYRDKITTDKLTSIPNIKSARMRELENGLKKLGLPMLNKSRTDTLIYRFHDPEYRERISDLQAEILCLKKWSKQKIDNTELSEMYGMSVPEIIKIISETKKQLKNR